MQRLFAGEGARGHTGIRTPEVLCYNRDLIKRNLSLTRVALSSRG